MNCLTILSPKTKRHFAGRAQGLFGSGNAAQGDSKWPRTIPRRMGCKHAEHTRRVAPRRKMEREKEEIVRGKEREREKEMEIGRHDAGF